MLLLAPLLVSLALAGTASAAGPTPDPAPAGTATTGGPRPDPAPQALSSGSAPAGSSAPASLSQSSPSSGSSASSSPGIEAPAPAAPAVPSATPLPQGAGVGIAAAPAASGRRPSARSLIRVPLRHRARRAARGHQVRVAKTGVHPTWSPVPWHGPDPLDIRNALAASFTGAASHRGGWLLLAGAGALALLALAGGTLLRTLIRMQRELGV